MFSNITIVEIISNILKLDSHDKMNTFIMKYNLPINRSRDFSLQRKKNDISNYLISNPNTKGILYNSLAEEIIIDIIECYLDHNKEIFELASWDNHFVAFPECPKLERYLLKDGFKIENGKLHRIIPSEIDIVKKENSLINILEQCNFTKALGHYRQAQGSFYNGNWAACNSQLRTYVESLFQDMAAKLNNNTPKKKIQMRL